MLDSERDGRCYCQISRAAEKVACLRAAGNRLHGSEVKTESGWERAKAALKT